MSDYRRPHVTGACVFFTVTLEDRDSTTLVDDIARLREAVRLPRADRPFVIDAFVVLPDHLHPIWTLPAGDCDFSTRWRLIKARFSRGLPKGRIRNSHHARNERAIWQRRLWEHHIRDEADYWAHVGYCWLNPVKHGLVDRPEDWPFSSVHHDPHFRAGQDLI